VSTGTGMRSQVLGESVDGSLVLTREDVRASAS